MAGSLAHIVDEKGRLRLHLVENRKDCCEALHECFDIIGALLERSRDPMADLRFVCARFNYPEPEAVPRPGYRAYRRPPTSPLQPVQRFERFIDDEEA